MSKVPMELPSPSPRHRTIADYALLGDCHGSALVAKDGSIDWAVLHRFDADPVFCRVLDAGRGGFWSLHPCGEYTTTRAYLPGTNILHTVFSTDAGRVAVTDFMPVGRRLDAGVNDYIHLNAPAWIVRRIEGLQGTVKMETVYRPSRDFARYPVQLAADDGTVRAGHAMPVLFGDLPLKIEGDFGIAVRRVTEGDRCDLVLARNTVTGQIPGSHVDEFFLQRTRSGKSGSAIAVTMDRMKRRSGAAR